MSLNSSEGTSSSSSRASWKYDVFVSFREDDTRKSFTDHLCRALDQKGINFFRDDEKLEKGKPISPGLLKAIKESRFSIVVISRTYATSSWCLDELVKIVECMIETGQFVYPVFYDVNPSELREQTGSFWKAFEEHEKAVGAEKLQKRKGALNQVANLPGWILEDGNEATLVMEIVKEIFVKLSHSSSVTDLNHSSSVTDGLVVLDSVLA